MEKTFSCAKNVISGSTVGIQNADVSGFQMVQSRSVLKWWTTIRKPDLKNVPISNVSGFRVVGFRIPTVISFMLTLESGAYRYWDEEFLVSRTMLLYLRQLVQVERSK